MPAVKFLASLDLEQNQLFLKDTQSLNQDISNRIDPDPIPERIDRETDYSRHRRTH
jgi:hypothetical protein